MERLERHAQSAVRRRQAGQTGLCVSRGCEYLWSTVLHLARDVKRVEDVDSSGPDHAADPVRYGCLRQRHEAHQVALFGV